MKSIIGSEHVVSVLIKGDKGKPAPLGGLTEKLKNCGDDLRISIVMLMTR